MTLLEEIKATWNLETVRELPDGTIVGVGRLIFTVAIYMDVERDGWGRCFCFDNRALCLSEYDKLTSGDDEPTGFIARRGG